MERIASGEHADAREDRIADDSATRAARRLRSALSHFVRMIEKIDGMDNGWSARGSVYHDPYLYAAAALQESEARGDVVLPHVHPRWIWRALTFELALFGLDDGRPHAATFLVACLGLPVEECERERDLVELLQRQSLQLVRFHCGLQGLDCSEIHADATYALRPSSTKDVFTGRATPATVSCVGADVAYVTETCEPEFSSTFAV